MHGLHFILSFVLGCLAQDSWNFQLEQIFKINWMFCQARRVCMSVFIRDGNILIEAVEISIFYKYFLSIGLFCKAHMFYTVCFLV